MLIYNVAREGFVEETRRDSSRGNRFKRIHTPTDHSLVFTEWQFLNLIFMELDKSTPLSRDRAVKSFYRTNSRNNFILPRYYRLSTPIDV